MGSLPRYLQPMNSMGHSSYRQGQVFFNSSNCLKFGPANGFYMMRVRVLSFLLLATLWAGVITSCETVTNTGPVIKTTLGQTISAAIKLITTTYEGAASENYLRGSQSQLVIAISAAQAIYANAGVLQVDVDLANDALNAAIATYQTQKVQQIDPANLVGHWTFDRMPIPTIGDPVRDFSGNGHDGVISRGHALWGQGIPTSGTDRYENIGQALHLNGGANIEIPFSSDINPAKMSISLWAKADVNLPIIGNQFLVALNRWNCFALKFDANPRAVFTVNPAENPGVLITEDNGTTLSQYFWRHIVVTFGDGHLKFYINGRLAKDWVHAGTVIQQSPGVSLVFGQDLPTSAYSTTPADPNYVNLGGYYIGYLDEIRLYKSVLTATQVSSIYQLESP
jgi:hypothetical protein